MTAEDQDRGTNKHTGGPEGGPRAAEPDEQRAALGNSAAHAGPDHVSESQGAESPTSAADRGSD
ncbi:MAG TPA: hypothetical protein VFB58_03895 [Chloroflexota bacterium]|nr:hypothetical protein [Chloroflexota bacterium]